MAQAPIASQLDALEKGLMLLHESTAHLQHRLSAVTKIRPASNSQGRPTSDSNNASAITNRLCHLQSIAAEIQQTINVLHEDLEL